jgi:uncharacterized tellurite resistance protein B-like protein
MWAFFRLAEGEISTAGNFGNQLGDCLRWRRPFRHQPAIAGDAQARHGRSDRLRRIAELLYCWCAPQMEDAMCYAKDYKAFDDQKKAKDTQVVQERRAGLIDRLLNTANKDGEKTKAEGTLVKEVAPAK